MREPAIQTRILASPPVFYGSWGLAVWLLYQWSLDDGIWPLIIGFGLFLAKVMKAEEEWRSYVRWRAEWDSMSGVVHPRRWPQRLRFALGIIYILFLTAIGQREGAQAVIGVLMITLGPVALIALLVKLWRRYRGRRRDRMEPVRVCIRGPVLPVPTLRDAYLGLPDHCRQVLEPRT